MMRMLLVMAIVLTANVVSAQDNFGPTFQNPTPPKTYASPVETVNFPYTELTQVRLWAPCNQRKDMHWWQLVRDHQGPGWKMVGSEMVYVEDRIYDHWIETVPRQAEERQPQTHTTIDLWGLRDEALREQELRGQEERKGKPKRLTEPVFRVPAVPEAPEQGAAKDEEEHLLPPVLEEDLTDAPEWEPVPKKKPAPPKVEKPRKVIPSGPTWMVHSSWPPGRK